MIVLKIIASLLIVIIGLCAFLVITILLGNLSFRIIKKEWMEPGEDRLVGGFLFGILTICAIALLCTGTMAIYTSLFN